MHLKNSLWQRIQKRRGTWTAHGLGAQPQASLLHSAPGSFRHLWRTVPMGRTSKEGGGPAKDALGQEVQGRSQTQLVGIHSSCFSLHTSVFFVEGEHVTEKHRVVCGIHYTQSQESQKLKSSPCLSVLQQFCRRITGM